MYWCLKLMQEILLKLILTLGIESFDQKQSLKHRHIKMMTCKKSTFSVTMLSMSRQSAAQRYFVQKPRLKLWPLPMCKLVCLLRVLIKAGCFALMIFCQSVLFALINLCFNII